MDSHIYHMLSRYEHALHDYCSTSPRRSLKSFMPASRISLPERIIIIIVIMGFDRSAVVIQRGWG